MRVIVRATISDMVGTRKRTQAVQALNLPELRDQAAHTLQRVNVAVTVVAVVAVIAVVILALGAAGAR
jgi:predicted lysophospholipase L1 biosynthesis ABC-type transport system permease subunit